MFMLVSYFPKNTQNSCAGQKEFSLQRKATFFLHFECVFDSFFRFHLEMHFYISQMYGLTTQKNRNPPQNIPKKEPKTIHSASIFISRKSPIFKIIAILANYACNPHTTNNLLLFEIPFLSSWVPPSLIQIFNSSAPWCLCALVVHSSVFKSQICNSRPRMPAFFVLSVPYVL